MEERVARKNCSAWRCQVDNVIQLFNDNKIKDLYDCKIEINRPKDEDDVLFLKNIIKN